MESNDPFILIAKMQDEINLNGRLRAFNFITAILQPLESKNGNDNLQCF